VNSITSALDRALGSSPRNHARPRPAVAGDRCGRSPIAGRGRGRAWRTRDLRAQCAAVWMAALPGRQTEGPSAGRGGRLRGPG